MQHKRTRSFQDLAAGRVSGPEPRYSVTGNTTPQDVEYSEEHARRNSLLASLMSQYLARGTLAIAMVCRWAVLRDGVCLISFA